jgi:ribose transport system substrate-binding protein
MTARTISRRALLQISALALTVSMVGIAPALADETTIAVIVKDTTSFYFQIVLAGARQAGKDLGVKVAELGTQSEADVNGQIAVLENAVAAKPAAVVIAPVDFKALGPPIDAAAKVVPVIGIDSSADS